MFQCRHWPALSATLLPTRSPRKAVTSSIAAPNWWRLSLVAALLLGLGGLAAEVDGPMPSYRRQAHGHRPS